MNSNLAMSGFFALAALGLTAGTVDTRRFSPVDYEPGWRAAANAAYKEAHDRFVAEEEAPWKAKEAPLVKAWEAGGKKGPRPMPGPRPQYKGPKRYDPQTILPEFEERVSRIFGPRQAQWERDFRAFREAEKRGEKVTRPPNPRRSDAVKEALAQAPTNGLVAAVREHWLMHAVDGFRLPLEFGTAGRYNVWIKYWQCADTYANLGFRLEVESTKETVRYTMIDATPDFSVATDAPDRKWRTEGRTSGFVWAPVEVNVEHPGRYVLALTARHFDFPREADVGARVFGWADCWISNDPAFNPEKATAADEKYPAAPVAPTAEGFVAARHHEPTIALNTAVLDTQKRLALMIQDCYQDYEDEANRISMGATDGLSHYENAEKYASIHQFNADVWNDEPEIKALEKKYPFDAKKPVGPDNDPIGRIGFWDDSLNGGKGGVRYSGNWSDSFEEYWAARVPGLERAVKAILADPVKDKCLGFWWTAWEQCGTYDYGKTSVANYRKFLAKLYGDVAALNTAWHTEYKSFDEIEPSTWDQACGKDAFADEPDVFRRDLKKRQAMANFIDFRDFCSKSYATLIGLKTKAVLKYDTKKRHISSNLSCNNLSSVMWMRWRPLDFEDTCRITMKGSDMVGYDNYGTDDLTGANYELFDAFGCGTLRPMIREGSTHAPSPHLFARTQFGNFAKGMRGMSCFCTQEHGHGELTKFGMSDLHDDASPRPKFAALADNFRAMNQMSHLVTETKRVRAVKPVAIYYSSACNVLQERPYASVFDCGPDNFFRVYELMHANGYDVTFVTDTHFRENPEWIDSLAAVLFIDATYVPTDVQEKVMAWVEKGGHVLADAQSCSCDGHGFPTGAFTEWLGVKPVQQKKFDENAAASALAFGYSAYSFDVIQRDALWKTAVELKSAVYGANHPIVKAAGKVMFSVMGYQQVKNIAGETILAENGGSPAWVIRNHGKGTSSYFAGYLGTAFGAGCTQYEWRDKHSDNSPYRFMDAYLSYIGAKKIAVNDLPRDVGYYVRHESPLVDARGNAAMGIVSQNPGPIAGFRAKYAMPDAVKKPGMVLVARNGSRKLESVPFAWDAAAKTLACRLPAMGVWEMAMALNECEPMVSVEAVDPKRDAYELVDFRPGDEVAFKVKVFNPSSKPLAAGEVQLRLPDGWFYDRETAKVGEVAPYGVSEELTFRVKAPSVNCARRLRPINFVYRNASVESCPAVEMAWFQKAPLEASKGYFGID